VPVNTVFPSAVIHTVCFVSVASQPYSQSWPTESKEPDFRLGKMWDTTAALGMPVMGRKAVCVLVV
jgi:hypothetical protein